jgi:allantoinase
VNVTAETCAHYLLMDEADLFRLGPPAKCAPPLRTEGQREELWQALIDGWVDTVGSDHSPCLPEMKTGDNFFQVWGGIASAQHAWPLFLETALLEKRITPSHFVRLTSTNVAKRFHLQGKGDLQVGNDADITLVALTEPKEITVGDLLTRHPTSAYVGRTMRLRVTSTFLRGEMVFGSETKTPSSSARMLLSSKA